MRNKGGVVSTGDLTGATTSGGTSTSGIAMTTQGNGVDGHGDLIVFDNAATGNTCRHQRGECHLGHFAGAGPRYDCLGCSGLTERERDWCRCRRHRLVPVWRQHLCAGGNQHHQHRGSIWRFGSMPAVNRVAAGALTKQTQFPQRRFCDQLSVSSRNASYDFIVLKRGQC